MANRQLDWHVEDAEEDRVERQLRVAAIVELPEVALPSLENILENLSSPDYFERGFAPNLMPFIRRLNADVRARSVDHYFTEVYLGSWGFRNDIIIKETPVTLRSKALVLHEIKIASTLVGIAADFIDLQPVRGGRFLRVGYRYYEHHIGNLLEAEDNETNWTVASEIFRVMHALEAKNYLMRDTRLQHFRVVESE